MRRRWKPNVRVQNRCERKRRPSGMQKRKKNRNELQRNVGSGQEQQTFIHLQTKPLLAYCKNSQSSQVGMHKFSEVGGRCPSYIPSKMQSMASSSLQHPTERPMCWKGAAKKRCEPSSHSFDDSIAGN